MPGQPTPGYLAKGAIHKKVDPLVGGRNNLERRQALLTALKDWSRDYIQILMEYTGLTRAEADYLRKTWYNPRGGWWPEHQPIEPIIRQSLITAIELAAERNLPLDSYWLAVGDQFQVIVACSDHQVTRLILTPPAPEAAADRTRLTAEMAIWVIKHSAPWEKIEWCDAERQIVVSRLKGLP
jgi:hypothetical protein